MPYSYPTTPGVTYAVECAAEVFVTNPQTGAVAVSGNGSATVYFGATDTLYVISNDSAKVQPLFKLAPRLKLALLQGVAGGWLPAGYTELEYLESSGTQYLQFDLNYSSEDSLNLRYIITPTGTTFFNYDRAWGSPSGTNFSGDFGLASTITRSETSVGQTLYWGNSGLDQFPYVRVGELIDAVFSPDGLFVQGVKYRNAQTLTLEPTINPFNLFTWGTWRGGVMRWCGLSNKRSGKTLIELIPALRNSDGVAGMWDKVSKQFFENAGTGSFGYRIKRTGESVAPMSLRDPWRVAPSGVYARVNGENELEILADTEEVSGEGWEWFANTAEAYEYFGIVQDELLTE